jgi:glycosyltransferase involved in cell wall biosynthesis
VRVSADLGLPRPTPGAPTASHGDAGLLRVSVVIPALDDATMLDRCLASLAAQRVPPYEVVVVDNGSVDATVEVAERHGARVVSEPRRGIGSASSAGYSAAGGDVIARCDADSVLPPDWIERIGAAFVADPTLGALTGPGVFYGAPRVLARLADVLYMRAYFAVMWTTLAHPALFGSNLALRRSVWLAVRDTVHSDRLDLHDDIDLSYHVGDVARIRYDPALRVGISARPFTSMSGLRLRVRRGTRSVLVHWPHDAPWRRHRRPGA